MKIFKRIIAGILALIALIILVVAGYVAYVAISYSRIKDDLALYVADGAGGNTAETGKDYTIVTQNFGFGAYTRDFTFFMDGGTGSRAKSKESVNECIQKAYTKISGFNPDFVIMREIDTKSTRSHKVNQKEAFDGLFNGYSSVYAVNYHSAYLMWPLFNPHGKSNSGISTYSRFGIESAVRKSLPISKGVSKFLDLDRCYSVSYVPCENGKKLAIFNVHTSAYGGSDKIRQAQMTKLFSDMLAVYEEGNYVVCGGDFNHDFTGTSTKDLNGGENVDFGWAQPFPDELIPEHFTKAISYSGGLNPTCRNCDVPYKEGNFTIIVDGFIVSDNVSITEVKNVVTGFEYSDHNPVVMKFSLK